MKVLRIFPIFIMVLIDSLGIAYAQESGNDRIFLLLVESMDSGTPHLRFSSVYAYRSSKDSSQLVVGERVTPFEVRLTGCDFLGMFKDISGKNSIQVTLIVKYPDGSTSCSAKSRSDLNIMHADPTGIGTGWPATIGDIEVLRRNFESRGGKVD